MTPSEQMLAELKQDDPIFLPSGFWVDLAEKNARMIAKEGMANFKRTVSQNYFNWLIVDPAHPFFKHVERLGPAPILTALSSLRETDHLRLTTSDEPLILSEAERDAYRRYVCHIWAVMRGHDKHGLRRKVREPKVGNPFPVRIGPRLFSQDLATSIIECNLLADLHGGKKELRVAELGAGYGRLAHVYAATQPGTYFVFDLPPALEVSQWYIEQVLGPDKVFRFRHFDDFEPVRREAENARVAFFTPNQLRRIPPGYFDTTVTISTFPEMRSDQVNMYLTEFQRITQKHIVIKQWRNWQNPVDGTSLSPDDYRLDEGWKVSYDQQDPIIPDFFVRVWKKFLRT